MMATWIMKEKMAEKYDRFKQKLEKKRVNFLIFAKKEPVKGAFIVTIAVYPFALILEIIDDFHDSILTNTIEELREMPFELLVSYIGAYILIKWLSKNSNDIEE